MPKNEAEAMSAAFDALKGQTPEIENRMLVWLHARLRESRRGREALAYKGPEPTEWRGTSLGPENSYGHYESRSECLAEFLEHAWEIAEVTGHAAVHQEFVVAVPIDGGGDFEYETFPTRYAAEAYVASMTANPKETH